MKKQRTRKLRTRFDDLFLREYADSQILIYDGGSLLHYEKYAYKERGRVWLRLGATPGIVHIVEDAESLLSVFHEDTKVELPWTAAPYRVESRHMTLKAGSTPGKEFDVYVVRRVLDPIEFQFEEVGETAVVALTSFPCYVSGDSTGQTASGLKLMPPMTFHAGGLTISLHEVNLREQGQDDGRFFSHFLTFKRKGGYRFKMKDFRPILERLLLFLSFFAGRKVVPAYCAVTSAGRVTWVRWDNVPVQVTSRSSWAEYFDTPIDNLELFESFNGKVRKKSTREWFDLYLDLSLDAGREDADARGNLIKAQSVLELLAGVFVEEAFNVHLSDERSAADRLRILFGVMGVPVSIDPKLRRLAKLSLDHGLTDYPAMITRVRNAIVHSTRDKREFLKGFSSQDLTQLRNVALLMAEMVVLRYLGYRGRISYQSLHKGLTAPAPWVE